MENIELINFTNLNLEQKKMILNWRNDKRVSKFMYETEKISLENHLRYIETLKNDLTKNYLLVKKDNVDIGVIDFTDINFDKKTSYFGLYSNPNIKIAGIGRILMKNILSFPYKKLYLEVFANNLKAINLYKKFKFQETGKKIVNNKDVICMELTK